MLWHLIAFGGLAFYGLLLLYAGVMIWGTEGDDGTIFGVFLTIGLLAILTLFSDFNPILWMWQNPWTFMTYFVIYFIVAVVYSVVKWLLVLWDKRDEYAHVRDNLKMRYDGLSESFRKATSYKEFAATEGYPPSAMHHKSELIRWLLFWPFSLVYTFFGQFVRRICTAIYEVLSNAYQLMSNKVFGSFDELR